MQGVRDMVVTKLPKKIQRRPTTFATNDQVWPGTRWVESERGPGPCLFRSECGPRGHTTMVGRWIRSTSLTEANEAYTRMKECKYVQLAK